MKNKNLIITNHSFNVNSVNQIFKSNNYEWLQLWPVLNSEKYSKFKVINDSSMNINTDHKVVSDFVHNISGNWWKLLNFDKIDKEFNIDGLRISQIFSYEFELELTKLLFNILKINRYLKRFSYQKIIFIYPKKFNPHFLYEFYKDKYNCEIKEIELKNNYNKSNAFLRIINFLRKKNLIDRILIKFYSKKISKNRIVISNSYRCLKNFILHKKVLRNCYILDDRYFIQNRYEKKIFTNFLKENNQQIIFDNISINPFINYKLDYIENKFFSLEEFFIKTKKFAINFKPKLYITVNAASSIEIVKIWAFKKSGVRSIVSSEGLGVPNKLISNQLNSVLHPELDFERWGFSKLFLNFFKNSSKKIITGFFDLENKIKDAKPKKIITFFLSSPNNRFQRAFNDEDIFEIIKSIKDVSRAVSCFKDFQLIIKVHPGDKYLIPILKSNIQQILNYKIILNCDNNKLIRNSKIIIGYNTSLILEALHYRRNVIFYNYTGRANYTTSFYKNVNNNPDLGTSIIEAKSKSELIEKIKLLISVHENENKCYGIDDFLFNASENYDCDKIINDLIDA